MRPTRLSTNTGKLYSLSAAIASEKTNAGFSPHTVRFPAACIRRSSNTACLASVIKKTVLKHLPVAVAASSRARTYVERSLYPLWML